MSLWAVVLGIGGLISVCCLACGDLPGLTPPAPPGAVPLRDFRLRPHRELSVPGTLGGCRLPLEWAFLRVISICMKLHLTFFHQGRSPPRVEF